MGTLTADSSRLPEYCDHKLPTSCRLSSIPECCACADERGHSAAYSVYIDGIGYVARGTRWQRYCWFCKEFWQNRVSASGLPPAVTRIPERPDQTDFLDRWYEFHQGFRWVVKDDGSEERVAVLGEPMKDVTPGYLPRTLDEMRAGAERNLAENTREHEQLEAEQEAPSGPTLDEALDQLMNEAAAEEEQQLQQRSVVVPAVHERANIHAQAMTPAISRNREYQARRVAALRRELLRMRNGIERVISGLRELGENVPDHSEATGRLTDLGRTLDSIAGMPSHQDAERAINSVNTLASATAVSPPDRTLANIQARVDEARQHLEEARRARDQTASEMDVAEQEFRTSQQRLQQIQRDQRSTENYMRLFGTREEMAAQGEDYVSPIGDMFSRAYERFRSAEQVRQEERTLRQVLSDESHGGESAVRRLSELEGRIRNAWGVPDIPQGPLQREVSNVEPPTLEDDLAQAEGDEVTIEEYYAMLRQQDARQQAPAPTSSAQSEVRNRPNQEEFPRNMLQAVMARRARRLSERNNTPRTPLVPIIDPLPPGESARLDALFGPNGAVLSPQELSIEDLVALLRRKERSHGDNDEELDYLLIAIASVNSYGVRQIAMGNFDDEWDDDILRACLVARVTTPPVPDHPKLAALKDCEGLLWDSGLITRRLAYLRSAGFADVMHRNPSEEHIQGIFDELNTIEYMAEAYQMSSNFRSQSGLDGMERLRMLYHLQAGHRESYIIGVLRDMVASGFVPLAREIHATAAGHEPASAETARSDLDSQRRRDALGGDHSRAELDAQRRATHAFAAAAGRLAMQTGPAALLEQMAERDPETRAAYNQMQANMRSSIDPARLPDFLDLRLANGSASEPFAFIYESDDESNDPEPEEEEPEAGLDAPDSGRPTEPLADEDMNVRMECRICYTQLAEIACLPCGHLVMCRWCSEQHSPVMAHDRTRPRRAAGCPVCRKGIRQKVRVFRGS